MSTSGLPLPRPTNKEYAATQHTGAEPDATGLLWEVEAEASWVQGLLRL